MCTKNLLNNLKFARVGAFADIFEIIQSAAKLQIATWDSNQTFSFNINFRRFESF